MKLKKLREVVLGYQKEILRVAEKQRGLDSELKRVQKQTEHIVLEQGDLNAKLGESMMTQNVVRNSKMVTVDKIELINKKLLENMFSISELEQKINKL